MTSTSAFAPPGPTTRLADRRRFRQSLAGLTGAAVITAGASVGMAATAHAATGDVANPAQIDIRNQFYDGYDNADITITDNAAASLYPSPVTFAGIQGTVTDVNVKLKGLTHAYPDDIDVMLVGPHGQRVILMSDVGGGDPVSNLDLTLDDEAGAALSGSTLLHPGAWHATDDTSGDVADPDGYPAPAPLSWGANTALSVFDGTDPNGTWNLYVVDDDPGVAGLLSGWTIDLSTTDGTTPNPSSVQVAGATGTVTDVDVALHGFSHEFPADVDLMLVGPGGQRALLMSDAGSYVDAAHLELGFDDEADLAVPDAQLTSRSYRPADYDADWDGEDLAFPAPAPGLGGIATSLSVFDGTDPNGTWKLFVTDDASDDHGAIEGGWSLHVTTTDPAPPTPGTTGSTPGAPGTTPAGDTTHPKVSGHTPKSGVTGVKRGADVKAVLSEKARKATVTTSTAKVVRKGSTKAVAATVRYDATTRTVTIDPTARLEAGATYRVVVTTGVKDLAGNALDQKPARTGLQKAVWAFTTR